MSRLTDEQVLKKCIEIALANGWDKSNYTYWNAQIQLMIPQHLENGNYFNIVFTHPFAKALFGTGRIGVMEVWEEELQIMVCYKNPIEYLRKWLETQPKGGGR